jgi:hypothetical protein
LAVIATGLERLACCHPLAVSLEKVALASKLFEAAFHRLPTWVPVLFGPL